MPDDATSNEPTNTAPMASEWAQLLLNKRIKLRKRTWHSIGLFVQSPSAAGSSGESTGTKWQDSHFAQPEVARRVRCMDALSESIHDVAKNE